MTTPVSFPLAKLLEEKGFEGIKSPLWYYKDGTLHETPTKGYKGLKSWNSWEATQGVRWDAPTIAEVVMWLYEKHGVWVSVDWMKRIKPYNSGFYCHLRGTNKSLNQDNFIVINDTLNPGYEVFDSPTEAYEAAIEYTLNNLI